MITVIVTIFITTIATTMTSSYHNNQTCTVIITNITTARIAVTSNSTVIITHTKLESSSPNNKTPSIFMAITITHTSTPIMEQISSTEASSVLDDMRGVVCVSPLSSYVTSTASTLNLSPQYCKRKGTQNEEQEGGTKHDAQMERRVVGEGGDTASAR